MTSTGTKKTSGTTSKTLKSKKTSGAKATKSPTDTQAAGSVKRVSRIPAPPVKPVVQAVDTRAAPVTTELKKQELLQKVVAKSDVKKKDAKLVVEAMLEVLGEALADGRDLNLQPLGKVKLNRTKETAAARIMVAKIRQRRASRVRKDFGRSRLAAVTD